MSPQVFQCHSSGVSVFSLVSNCYSLKWFHVIPSVSLPLLGCVSVTPGVLLSLLRLFCLVSGVPPLIPGVDLYHPRCPIMLPGVILCSPTFLTAAHCAGPALSQVSHICSLGLFPVIACVPHLLIKMGPHCPMSSTVTY